jgi:hypothetical protein
MKMMKRRGRNHGDKAREREAGKNHAYSFHAKG